MLETAWVLLSELLNVELLPKLLRGYPELPEKLGIKELEEFNIPLTSMICTGVGQGGAVSKLFYEIQKEAKKRETNLLSEVLDNVRPQLDELIELHGIAEFLSDISLKAVKKVVVSIAKNVKDSRYDKEFFNRDSVKERFSRFYAASCIQAEELELTPPNKIIFGHTHDPIPESNPMETNVEGRRLSLYNTGGWLRAEGEGKSAEVFFLDDNGILSSVNIQ